MRVGGRVAVVAGGMIPPTGGFPIRTEVPHGFTHAGQTEFIAERCGVSVSNVAMMLTGPSLRTVPVTTHVALGQVQNLLTQGLIEARGRAALRGHSRCSRTPRRVAHTTRLASDRERKS